MSLGIGYTNYRGAIASCNTDTAIPPNGRTKSSGAGICPNRSRKDPGVKGDRQRISIRLPLILTVLWCKGR